MTYEFHFNDFIFITDKRMYTFHDKKSDKKRDEIITKFSALRFFCKTHDKYYDVISSTVQLIDLITILNSFYNNKLDTEEIYDLNVFIAKVVSKDKKIYLSILFKNYENSLFLNKFEAGSLHAKFQKYLNQCKY